MALTSEQINEIRAKDKLPPIESLPTTSPTVDRAKELQSMWGTPMTTESKLKEQDTGYLSGLGARTAEEQVAGAKKIGASVKKGAEDMAKPGVLNKIKGAAEAGFGTITGAAQTALAPVTATISPVVSAAAPRIIEGLKAQHPILAKVFDTVSPKIQETLAPKIKDLIDKHPDASVLTGDIINTILLGIGGSATKGSVKSALKSALSKEALMAEEQSVIKTAGKITQRSTKNELIGIQEKISPKLTTKETKIALQEGRLIKGRDPSLLRGGTPDTVVPSEKVVQSAQTIQREIPKASKMKEPDLYIALEGRTADMAQKLKPEMQKVKIKEPTVEKITSEWEKIKKTQMNDPYLPRTVNIKKLQSDFETRLVKSKADNIDDLWETRKAYDASVPTNVKQATSLSSDSLQAQKEIWLQNRRILNDAINDEVSGVGEVSRKAFSDMSDLYNAKLNLLSKAKVDIVPPASKLKQWVKDNPWKSAIAAYGAGKAVEGATGINIPAI